MRYSGCPRYQPRRVSTSPGLWKPRAIKPFILFCVAGRMTDLMQASHPAAISTSGGKLALTRFFVLAMAYLSNAAIRVATAVTKSSSSASGNERFT